MGEEEQDGAVPCSLPSSKTMHSPHPEKLHLSIVAEIFLKDYLLVLAVGFRYLSRVQWFRPTIISFTCFIYSVLHTFSEKSSGTFLARNKTKQKKQKPRWKISLSSVEDEIPFQFFIPHSSLK